MDQIPVSFEYKGKQYSGFFSPVSGAASKIFTLTIDGFHKGYFSQVEDNATGGIPRPPGPIKYKWKFTSQSREFEDPELEKFFESVILAWYS